MISEANQDVEHAFSNLVKSVFSENNGIDRRRARMKIAEFGYKATPYMIDALKSANDELRWEAAKALIEIRDPRAAQALAEALSDESFEIQWLAAEALIELDGYALKPLLKKLIADYDSPDVRRAAHQILMALKRKDLLDEEVIKVIEEVSVLEPLEPYPIAAKKALAALERKREMDIGVDPAAGEERRSE